MRKRIKDGVIVDCDWQQLAVDTEVEAVPEGKILVPLAVWQAHKETLKTRGREQLGVILEPGESPRDIADDLDDLAVVAIHFPVFSDGRGYSSARQLREHYRYKGEVRAIGDVLKDQLFLMQRVGFNGFALREDLDIESALPHFSDFSLSYQAAQDDPRPLLRR